MQGVRLRRVRLSVAVFFFVNGATFGTWVGRVPAVREQLGLSAGQLGAAFAGWSAAAIVALPLAGAVVARVGSRLAALGSVVLFTTALALLAVAPGFGTFVVVLAAFGAANSGVDVATNAQSVHVERAYQRPILSGFHALFSGGVMAGGLGGSLAAALGVAASVHFATSAAVLAALSFLVLPGLPVDPHGTRQGPAFAWPSRALILPGLVLFCAAAMEDIANSWSAVYLRSAAGAAPDLAAAGVALISAAMIAGRTVGDRIRARLGGSRFLVASGTLAALGAVIALLFPRPAPVAVGFVLLGLGLAGLFPVVLSHVGHHHRTNTGQAIAAVSTVGYLGSLAGPGVVGGLSEVFGLRGGLALLPAFAVLVTLLAWRFWDRANEHGASMEGSRGRQRHHDGDGV